MGTWQYEPLVDRFSVPIVVTGFEPLDVLDGIRRVVVQLQSGQSRLENAYPRVVTEQGNVTAQRMLDEVFDVCDRNWRGIGEIPQSGWRLTDRYARFDAAARFAVDAIDTPESGSCRSGDVLRGLIKPSECAAFGVECTPRTPLGAPMVSNEGACAAYHQYRRLAIDEIPVRPPAGSSRG
jgi:hydrogenase expression/formation protein HypD